jgi:hypothetical protein
LVLAAILLFTTLNPGLARASIESWYFKRHPWTLERVKRVWGEPIQVETRPDGVKIYTFDNPDAAHDVRWFAVKDGHVIDGGL